MSSDTQPYRKKPRGFETAADMARTLVPLAILVLLVVWFCSPKNEAPVQTVDVSDDVSGAGRFADFPVVAPDKLPEGWRPTSSALLRSSDAVDAPTIGLTIGYVTPEDQFLRFTIRQGEQQAVLDTAVDGADVRDVSDDTVTVDGRGWTPFTTADGRGWVHADGSGATAVVLVLAGTADDAELRQLAGSLRTVPKT